jgi:signal peptide peptidase SppA
MSNNYLAHIADRVLNRPLMVMPDKLILIASVLEGRIGIEGMAAGADVPMPEASRHIGNYELDPTSSSGGKKPYRQTADGTAIIPVVGSLVGRGGWIGAMSGVASYENIKFALGAAVNDKTIKNIVLDMDSPGGEAVGAFETADAVRAATAKKEVIAVATGLMCSAAYAIASAASQIVTTKSSVVGSIGVCLLHADYSHALHERGVVPTLIHAGKRKVDGTPYKPLTDDVKASLKAEVEKFNSLFVATVAEGRPSLTPNAILAMEAGTYIGVDAVKVGLADRVGTLEDTLARLSNQAGPRPGGSSRAGLLLSIPTAEPKADVDLDRVAKIIAAGHRAGLLAFAQKLAEQPSTVISLQAALDTIDIAAKELARDAAAQHPSGLFFGPVAGGPLFNSPDRQALGDDNHGWSDVVSAVNRRDH